LSTEKEKKASASKRSPTRKEVEKKERFADLFVILGIKYTDFNGKQLP